MVSIGDESYVAWREDSEAEEQEAIRQMDGDAVTTHNLRRAEISPLNYNNVAFVLILFIRTTL